MKYDGCVDNGKPTVLMFFFYKIETATSNNRKVTLVG